MKTEMFSSNASRLQVLAKFIWSFDTSLTSLKKLIQDYVYMVKAGEKINMTCNKGIMLRP